MTRFPAFAALEPATASVPAPFDPVTVRADFPILGKVLDNRMPLVYFDNAATTQRPRQVIQALVETYEEHYANVHRGIHTLAQEADERFDAAREKVRAFLNAPSVEQVIFTSGTTAAINLVARTWGDANVHQGDEILLSEMEHHSNLVPWQQLAERTGAVLRHLPLTDDGLLQLDALDQLLAARTKLVAITAVSNVLGTINPVAEIIRRAHQAGALVLVDAAQSVPHQKTDVAALDVDFLAFSGHKMLGPSGVGILYGKREWLEAMPPFLGGGSMIRRVALDRFEPADLPWKFEAGTPPIAPAIGLGAAIDYLHGVGFEAIRCHELLLTQRAHAVLGEIEGVRILGPQPQQKGGIVSFVLEHIHAHDVAEVLDRYGIAVRAGHHCAMPLHKRYAVTATARASFYFYNTLSEIDKLGEALAQVKRVFHRRK
jgi:cysteine desulfurase / selenocysteine lyase